MIEVKVIADSINRKGHRLTTLSCKYPRYIHSEVMTHRMFSRNASSSRAIPVKKMIESIEDTPVKPIWMENTKGMQADQPFNSEDKKDLNNIWRSARNDAISSAQHLIDMGVHKQIVNRLLEPFAHITTLISATEWDNFFKLRITKQAQQEIYLLAKEMKKALDESVPQGIDPPFYHLPFIVEEDLGVSYETLRKYSVARCARVSYLNHDNSKPDRQKDIELHDMLKENRHSSPFEHVAIPIDNGWDKNFHGWFQYRSELKI